MIAWTEGGERIAADFDSESIPTQLPGFYDHPEFLRVEAGQPSYLNNYARFVETRTYSDHYLSETRRVLARVLPEIATRFAATGRVGGCVDFAIVLSRILEDQGIWNYSAKGALTVTFPAQAGLEPQFFWPVDYGNFVAGHAWVVAPPYRVIDLSVSLQPWLEGATRWLPAWIASEGPSNSKSSYRDIISSEVQLTLTRRGVTPHRFLDEVNPDIKHFLRLFPPTEVNAEGTILKYTTVAVGAPDCPFHEARNLNFDGLTPAKYYEAEIRPLFRAPERDV